MFLENYQSDNYASGLALLIIILLQRVYWFQSEVYNAVKEAFPTP